MIPLPRFTFNGNGSRHISNGLELFYDWTSCLTAGSIWKNLAPKPSGSYDTTLSTTQTQLCDEQGLKSFGFPTLTVGYGTQTTAAAVPMKFVISSGFNKALTDFTLVWTFEHLAATSDGPQTGECVIASSTISICRNGTTANSWILTVPDGSTAAQSITTDGSFATVVMRRSGSTTTFYKSDGVPAQGALTALATVSGSTTTGANTLFVGGKSGPANYFEGRQAMAMIYNRALADDELRATVNRIRVYMSKLGVTLP